MGFSFPDNFRESVANVIKDWDAFAKAHEEESPVSIRINPGKISGPFELDPVPWNPNGYYLNRRPHFTMDPWFQAGVYYPQEPGSMMLDHILRQLPLERGNLRVLDLCAAPGGKSTLILDWLDGEGFLVCNEVIGKRARILRENLDKWGHANRLVTNSDPVHFGKLGKVFDIVVIDAPCSGEGMFRKTPDAVQMWNEDIVEHCHQRQLRIVRDALECLKPGGFLIYSTCTYNTRENEEVLAPIKDEFDAQPVSIDAPSQWGIYSSERHGIPSYRFLPHRLNSEGFCISVLQMPAVSRRIKKDKRIKKQSATRAASGEVIGPWLLSPQRFAWLEHRKQNFFLPADMYEFAHHIAAKIHVLTIGTEAGRIIRGELIPAAPLALSVDLDSAYLTSVALSDDQIIDYLCKRDIREVAVKNGWTLCTYRGMTIGWAKTVDGKLKNHWPKEWRIVHAANSIEVAIK